MTRVRASAATTASLRNGTLSVFGDNGADRCTRMATLRKFGRDAVDGYDEHVLEPPVGGGADALQLNSGLARGCTSATPRLALSYSRDHDGELVE